MSENHTNPDGSFDWKGYAKECDAKLGACHDQLNKYRSELRESAQDAVMYRNSWEFATKERDAAEVERDYARERLRTQTSDLAYWRKEAERLREEAGRLEGVERTARMWKADHTRLCKLLDKMKSERSEVMSAITQYLLVTE